MANKIENLYSRFITDFVGELQSDEFYAYFSNMMKSGASNMSLNEKFVERNIDLRWVEAIENTIVPLDTIIRNPNRYIKNLEEVVPIEMARTISTESVRHLATHTNLIAEVKGDTITPHHILNVIKEESFDTYENRFIFTLLFKIEYFLDKRMEVLMADKKIADRYEMRFDGQCTAGNDEVSYDVKMTYVTPHVDLAEEVLDVGADVTQLSAMQRIERLRKILYSFKGSALIKALAGCAMVRPPLTMTNVLTKNPNFKKCVDLWGFVERYEDVGFSVNVVERATTPSQQFLGDMFSLLTLQYVVMKKNTARTNELGNYSERKNELKPNVIKKSIDELIETYDLDIEEFKRVFIDQIEKKRKKIKAEFTKIKDVIKRAIATDKEYLTKYTTRRDQRIAREQAKMLKEEKQERLEQERLEQERLERERLEQERLEQERLERERLEQERLERERLEQERLEQERLERERLEQERLERERLEQERLAEIEKQKAEEVAIEEPNETVEEVAIEEPNETVEEIAIEEPSETVEEIAIEEPTETKPTQESFLKRIKVKISSLWSKLRKKDETQALEETAQEPMQTIVEEIPAETEKAESIEVAVVEEEIEIPEEPVVEETVTEEATEMREETAVMDIEKKERIDKRKARRAGRTRSLPKNYKTKTNKK